MKIHRNLEFQFPFWQRRSAESTPHRLTERSARRVNKRGACGTRARARGGERNSAAIATAGAGAELMENRTRGLCECF